MSRYSGLRHSGAGRNPACITAPREAGRQGLVRFAGFLSLLDSGLRRMTSDLPACGLSRMASCSVNDVKGAL
jgi:hypothetical protein